MGELVPFGRRLDAMSDDDIDKLTRAIGAMVVMRGGSKESADLAIYFVGLADLDVSLVERACQQLGMALRKEYEPILPEVGVIRQIAVNLKAADEQKDQNARMLPMPASKSTYSCDPCMDTGFRLKWCRGRGDCRVEGEPPVGYVEVDCDSSTPNHRPHTYAVRCQCYTFNPVLSRQREQLAAARGQREDRDVMPRIPGLGR